MSELIFWYAMGVLGASFAVGLFEPKSPDGDPRTILLAVVLWPLGCGMALGAAVRWCLLLRKLS